MPPKIAIIIPYYQREPGLLGKALRSVADQDGDFLFDVVVVDDGSPSSARAESDLRAIAEPHRLRIIEQANAGPSAARNRGLDEVDADTDFVAFLDSDDQWSRTHIANALEVFERGYDFYFANHIRPDWPGDKFQISAFDIDRHTRLDHCKPFYEYNGDMTIDVLLGNIIQTSTVVYKFEKIKDLRFPNDLSILEDNIFWANVAQRIEKIGFCADVESHMGRGVNISQVEGWGTEKSLDLTVRFMRAWRKLPALLSCDARLYEIRGAKIRELRRSLVAEILHRAARREKIDLERVIAFFRADPATIALFLPLAVSISLDKLTSKRR